MDLKKITPPTVEEAQAASPKKTPPKDSSKIKSSPNTTSITNKASEKIKSLPASTKAKFPIWARVLVGVLAFLLVFASAIAIPSLIMIKPTKVTIASARTVVDSIQNQDLVAAKDNLNKTKDDLTSLQKKYQLLVWLKVVPILRNYYLDGERVIAGSFYGIDAGNVLIDAIGPYSDLLGFKSDQEAVDLKQGETAEERIIFLAQTLSAISPQLDEVGGHLTKAQEEFSQINPKRYPVQLAGKQVRSSVIQLQDGLAAAATSLTEAQPLIALLPSLLGQDGEKTYMLLFQNDGEIRPTGGFLTAYAYITVNKGKLTPKDSFNIYDLDARFTNIVEAPDPIKRFLKENRWYIRNMNLSPDFKVSMDTFMEHYRDIPGVLAIDGIIALDTEVPVKLLEVLGTIGVSGWGNFSADIDDRCDCPQVVYELENISTRPKNYLDANRKAVLGPLMHSIMANAMGSPKAKWPQLLNVGLTAIKQKHLMFYFLDETSQASAEAFAAAGRILPYEGDYLHINDANFGGAKSNLFTEESVEQEINIDSDGKVTKTVSITYNNPHPASSCDPEKPGGDLCLNALLSQWVRLYVPKGSQLIEVVGSTIDEATSEDLGKTVFEAFFTLRPQSSSKLVFTYELPGTYAKPYKLLIQKQPGKDNIIHSITFNGIPKEVEVESNLEVTLP